MAADPKMTQHFVFAKANVEQEEVKALLKQEAITGIPYMLVYSSEVGGGGPGAGPGARPRARCSGRPMPRDGAAPLRQPPAALRSSSTTPAPRPRPALR